MLRVGRNGDCCVRLNIATGTFAAVTEGGNLHVQWKIAPQQLAAPSPTMNFNTLG